MLFKEEIPDDQNTQAAVNPQLTQTFNQLLKGERDKNNNSEPVMAPQPAILIEDSEDEAVPTPVQNNSPIAGSFQGNAGSPPGLQHPSPVRQRIPLHGIGVRAPGPLQSPQKPFRIPNNHVVCSLSVTIDFSEIAMSKTR